MNYDDVLRIRNAQNSMRKRFEDAKAATTEEIAEMVQTETARQIGSPRVTEIEAMIFRMRTELIDYIVAHGLVDGWTMDGALQPVENGKIPLTSELLQDVVSKMGYLTEDQIKTFLERFLPENHYVSDENYVHTDNNFTDGYETKLDGVEDGAEVNLVNDVTLDGKSVLINKVASLTAESIKKSYESNSNTNAFTDADKAKLAGIADGAEKNRVDDVLVDGRSVLNENKKAVISKEIIKQAYESNPNTNAFTDNEKSKLEGIASGAEVNLVNDVTLDGETLVENKVAKLTAAKVKSAYESNPDTNAFTDAEKQAIANNTAKGEANAGAIDQLSQDLSSSVGQIGQEIAAIQSELTPEAIKLTYESNPDTNAFTDTYKSKLEGIASGAEVNLVNDVTLDGETLVENKVAKLTAAKVKSAYESNPDTNAFTDAEKEKLASISGPSPIFSAVGTLNNKYINVPDFLRNGDTQFLLQTITSGTDFLFVSFGLSVGIIDINAPNSPFGKTVLIPITEEDLALPPGKEPIAPGYGFMNYPVGFVARGQQGTATKLNINNFTACASVNLQFFWTANKKGFELRLGDNKKIDGYTDTAFSIHTGKAQILLPLKNK